MRSDATIDAVLAATVLTARERGGRAQTVVLTSDPEDLSRLLADETGIRVVAA